MTEALYWKNINRGEDHSYQETPIGYKRVSKNKLNPDQRGWAQLDHPLHFHMGYPWLINPAKPSRPIPDLVFIPDRDVKYRRTCNCESNEVSLYGKAYDGSNLVRCSECKQIMKS